MMPRRAAAAAALMVLALGSMLPAASAETIAEVFERVHRSVVVIRALEMDVPAEEGEGPSGRNAPAVCAARGIAIRDVCRLEGTSDPDDMSLEYAIESTDGTRGILVREAASR